MNKRCGLFLILILTALSFLPALEVPPLKGAVNDTANILSPALKNDMNAYLSKVESVDGVQIAVLTVPSLEGESIESFSINVVDQWKLGQTDKDNGVLLLVSVNDRKIRIETGYGLEGSLTDAISGYIIREIMVPHFKKGDFDSGITAGMRAIADIVTGNAPIESSAVPDNQNSRSGIPGFLFLFPFIFLFSGLGRYGRYRRRGFSPTGAFFAGAFLGNMMGASRGSSGFDSGGFGGGGGFSGGGGGFGGGGASGGW